MNVLSLFDGMSCGRIALERAGIEVNKYYASELDKYAINVTQANWPNTIQLGDVTKWQEWDIDWSSIDLLIGGSPCQGFSFAGKQLAFDDPRSKLFFVYSDILTHIDNERDKAGKKEVKFLLENVKMKKDYLEIISDHLGVKPVFINSALVSAQSRQRYYWANWEFGQPEDKSIVLADIIEIGAVDRTKAHCIDANYFKGGNLKSYFEKSRRQLVFKNPAAMVGRKLDKNGKRKDDKTNTLTTVQKDNVIGFTDNYVQYDKSGKGYKSQDQRAYYLSGKMGTLAAHRTDSKTNTLFGEDNDKIYYRKLTPVECERLQTVPDNYTNHVSNTQRYKMLGNGWTVDVIAHIFKSLTPKPTTNT